MQTNTRVKIALVGASDRQLEELLRPGGAQIVTLSIDDLPGEGVVALEFVKQ